ncbi:MAG: DUF1127 domain-containing protein [Amaricoccus sp.]
MTVQTPAKAAPASAPLLHAAHGWCRACLADLLRAAMERDARFRASRQLARMEDHLLRDIGLTRDDVRGGRL